MSIDIGNMAAGRYACTVFRTIKKVEGARKDPSESDNWTHSLPSPSKRRRTESLSERPYNLGAMEGETLQEYGGGPKQPETVFYLAYGSNLCAETFHGKRGIRPLSRTNVVVPELVMTFDLAGLPYVEPCFANTKYRETRPESIPSDSETSHLLPTLLPKYHKARWPKGLVGVVYEVSKADFAHIIATEGGGASYQDVLVECYELSPSEQIVPDHPTAKPFKAHTLYSPIFPPGEKPRTEGGRFSRPDPDYAQPSARYLKLINDGAYEHGLPQEYKSYLHQLRPYTMTTQKQKLGARIFSMIWMPLISTVFGLNKIFADKKGKAPPWLVAVTGAIFKGMWVSYDEVFFKLFGDGERTLEDERDEDGEDEVSSRVKHARLDSIRYGAIDEKGQDIHQMV